MFEKEVILNIQQYQFLVSSKDNREWLQVCVDESKAIS